MKKTLSEMTLEELWELFPIFLTEHKAEWQDWYNEESRRLEEILAGSSILRISHIGSTAVPGIWAKPIIDILVEIAAGSDMERVKSLLTQNSYLCMSQSENRISFNRGYTEDGFAEKVFHLHLRFAGDHDELYFRDFLKEHPGEAREYEALKLRLWEEFEHDRDGYTAAKEQLVAKFTAQAKILYAGRYE